MILWHGINSSKNIKGWFQEQSVCTGYKQVWKEIGVANLFQIFIQMAWESSVSNHDLEDSSPQMEKPGTGWYFFNYGPGGQNKALEEV